MKPPRTHAALLLAGTLPFTGCQTYEEYGLTHKLWSDPSLTDHYKPAGTRALKTFRHPSSARLLAAQGKLRFTSPAPARVARRVAGGPQEVFNLEGAIFDWACEGRPLERDGQPVREVHPFNWLGRLMLPRGSCAPAPSLRH